MTLTKDETAELFTVQVRGAIATAYLHANKTPLPHHAQMIRGTREITMRDIGEVGFETGVEFTTALCPRDEGAIA
ncbi:hypothetical protein [Phaeobacter phage MD18]|nr:hypothetical protein [Phaeobacter phage MD18]